MIHGNGFHMRRTKRGGVTGPVMPATANLAMLFEADDITPQTSGTAFSGTWTDRIAAVGISQATSAQQPTYQTGVLNGKPSLRFNGSKNLVMGRPTPMINAMNQWNDTTGYTMFFVVANDATTGNFRCLFSPSNVNDNSSIICSASHCGGRSGGATRARSKTGFRLVVVRRSSIYNNSNIESHIFDDFNACIGVGVNGPHATNNYQLGGDGTGTASWGFSGDLFACGWYNKALTTAEIANLYKFYHAKYGVAVPWNGLSRFFVFDGDSQTAFLAENSQSWSDVLMANKGVPFTGYTNVAQGSRTSAQMAASAPGNYTGLAAALGIPIGVYCLEYYNQTDTTASGMLSYMTAVRTAAPAAKICALDSFDNSKLVGNAKRDNRAAFNSAMAAAGATYYDVFAPISTNATIGIEGACPDDPGPYGTNFSDGIHLTAAGNVVVAGFMGTYHDSLVALL